MAEKPRRQAPRRGKSAKTTKAAKPKRAWWKRLLLWSGVTLLSLALIAGVGMVVVWNLVKIPDPNADFQTNTSFVYYNDGKSELGSFQIQNRVTIAYADMNPYVKDAIVAAENRTFWEDAGFDPAALARAAFSLFSDEQTVGGSTITQQYIKVLYLTQEKTFTRKAKELILAVKMGQTLSKEQILAGYLNTVYFGRGAYGIEAAAQAYFNKTSAKLTLAQSVALAAIVNSPGNLDPALGDKQAADLLERYQYTLNGMVEAGTITEAQRAEIYSKLPKFPKITKDSRLGGSKGFLLSMVEAELAAKGFSEDVIAGGGLRVTTTFDADAQAAAVESAQEMTLAAAGSEEAAKNIHAALVSIDNNTGGVLALYGGPDYVESQKNWATTARATGSTSKPYALAAAFRDGWTLNDTLNGNSFTPDGDSTPVRNAGGRNYGRVTLLRATTSSINTAYVDLVDQLPGGWEDVQEAAIDAGVPADGYWDTSNRIALGASEISPYRAASAYSTFANQGLYYEPHVVAEVTDSAGRVLYTAPGQGERTLEKDVAIDVSYALSKVAQDGTGSRAAQLGYPVAGKTGSRYIGSGANAKTVAGWFVGFTRQITTSVMFVAGDDGNANLGSSFTGSGYPAMTWLSYMRSAMAGKEAISFDSPTYRTSTRRASTEPSKSATAEATPTVTPSATPTETAQPTVEPSSTPSSNPTTAPATQPPTTTAPAPPTVTPESSAPESTEAATNKADAEAAKPAVGATEGA